MVSHEDHTDDPIRIGVSACLLGQTVRYDGGHKRDSFVAETLGRCVEFVPVCPEVELGLGVPRETLRLVRRNAEVRMIGTVSGRDFTQSMRRFAARRVRGLDAMRLSGYVLKKGSPSCGMDRVRAYTDAGVPAPSSRGLFADELIRRMSLVPVEEEGRLNDPVLRESFIERIYAYRRLRRLFRAGWSVADLVRFQANEKLLLMAHEPAAQRVLGRCVAGSARIARHGVAGEYGTAYMNALARPAPHRRHVNVLQHVTGYFKRDLDVDDRRELAAAIEDYKSRRVPLVVPITLVRHHVRKLDVAYLRGQSYLELHPQELMLRNHA